MNNIMRHFKLLVTVFLISLSVSPTTASASAPGTWENQPLVKTGYGWVRGRADKGPTWCWKGIPYATPPVGQLRWKAPKDPQSWQGILQTRKFKSPASQLLPVIGAIGSEDCLYLNVWRPVGAQTGLPVYVFIHGGGNSIGTGTARDYWGHAVAGQSGMVYVTVNFRLGVMGWFRHPAVTGSGSLEDQSGNFGTLDLIKALEWIHGNIGAFGGDPGNVTISGESGGAMDVLSLLTSPLAKGLFHRAVVESGLTIIAGTAAAEQQSAGLLARLLVADGSTNIQSADQVASRMTPQKIDKYLRSKSAHELMKHIPKIVGGMAEWHSILTDGTVIPAEGYGVFHSGQWANKVPVLIGVNKDEMKLFRYLLKDPPTGSREYELLSRYQSLLWRLSGLDTVATAMTAHPGSPPVYAYRFDWGSPDEQGKSVLPGKSGLDLGANHYAEIPFFLGMGLNQLSLITGSTYSKANRSGREKLTALCLSYLANFARNGDPNGTGLPRWNPWNPDPGGEKYIILDAGFNDLRISGSNDAITLAAIINLIHNQLSDPERKTIVGKLKGPIPFGLGN